MSTAASWAKTMKRLFRRRLILAAGCVAIATAAWGQLRPVNPHIVSVAERWLSLLDGERYDEAREETSSWYRAVIADPGFLLRLEGVRRPLGRSLSRALWRETYWTSLKGRPDGRYYQVVFSTVFETKASGTFEHVLLESEGGQWKVTGYYLR